MKMWAIKRVESDTYFMRINGNGHWTPDITKACYEWETKADAKRFCEIGEIPVAVEVITTIKLRKTGGPR